MAAILNSSILKSAILNSAILDSDTANMDWDTLLSSLRWTQKHSPSTLTLTQTNSIWLTRWWQPSWILPSWILPSWIQPFAQKNFTHSFSLKLMIAENLVFCSLGCSHFAQKKLHFFILTQLDDGSHLEFCHVGFRHCNLDSNTLLSSLRFTQKHSSSTLTLTQTNSIWLT